MNLDLTVSSPWLPTKLKKGVYKGDKVGVTNMYPKYIPEELLQIEKLQRPFFFLMHFKVTYKKTYIWNTFTYPISNPWAILLATHAWTPDMAIRRKTVTHNALQRLTFTGAPSRWFPALRKRGKTAQKYFNPPFILSLTFSFQANDFFETLIIYTSGKRQSIAMPWIVITDLVIESRLSKKLQVN